MSGISQDRQSLKDDNKRVASEIESLKNGLKKLTEENEKLTEKLEEAKRKKKRRKKEFEEERDRAYRKVEELEAAKLELLEKVSRLSGEGITQRDQFEMELENLKYQLEDTTRQLNDTREREHNFKQQLSIVKKSLTDKELLKQEMEAVKERTGRLKELSDALCLENARLKEELEEHSRLLDLARRENNSLRLQTNDSNELERDFELQKQLMLTVLEGETSKANMAFAETEVVKETARANEDSLKEEVERLNELLLEKQAALDNEVIEKWKFHAEKEEKNKEMTEKEFEWRKRIEELSNALLDARQKSEDSESARNAELRAENEKLLAFMKSKEKKYEEKVAEREMEHALQVKRLEEEWKTKLEELEEKLSLDEAKHSEHLSAALKNNKKMAEELRRKTNDCSELEEKLVKCRLDGDKANHKLAELNDEDKIGKLERAIVRLKLENDQLKSAKDSNGMKDLLREKQSHIVDLQKEVTALRETMKKYHKDGNAEAKLAAADEHAAREKYHEISVAHRKLLDETAALRTALETGSQDATVLIELFEAKKKLNASGARISQLEKWLDEIYATDPNPVGLGPRRAKGDDSYRTSFTLPELKSQTRAPNRLSKPRPK